MVRHLVHWTGALHGQASETVYYVDGDVNRLTSLLAVYTFVILVDEAITAKILITSSEMRIRCVVLVSDYDGTS